MAACALLWGGCKGERDHHTSPRAAPVAGADAMWAFAPPGLEAALVARDGSLARLHAGLVRALESLEKAPGGRAVAAAARAKLTFEGVDLLDAGALAGLGIDLTAGAALFVGKHDNIAVVPVRDTRRLVARFRVSSADGIDRLGDEVFCKPIAGRYVCAQKPGSLARAGVASPSAMWPAEMRGDLEMFAGPELVEDSAEEEFRVDQPQGFRASVLLERGGFTARAHIAGRPAGKIARWRSSPSPLLKAVAQEGPAGVLFLQAGELWREQRAAVGAAAAQPLPGGVTLGQALRAMSGELAVYTLPGPSVRGGARLGLSDAAPMRKLLDACDEMGARLPAGARLSAKGNHCVLEVDPRVLAPQAPAAGPFSLEMWAESDALVVQFGEAAGEASAPPEPPVSSAELLSGSWSAVLWGYGALRPGSLPYASEVMDRLRAVGPAGGLVIWGLLHLSEIGFAMRIADDGVHMLARVRTLWSNPDAVVTDVERRIGDFVGGDAGALDSLEAIAARHPHAPFARDSRAGGGFFLVHTGVLAAVALPALMNYVKKSKTEEARLQLRTMLEGARAYRKQHGRLPGPSSAATPPIGACCAVKGYQCAPDPALWNREPWRSLRFSLERPHRYSYQYWVAPDGKSFRVSAVGDLDCDGVPSSFEMSSGAAASGEPELTVHDELE